MSNAPIPLAVADISKLTRAISKQLKDNEETPSHLSMMNIVARAAGFRNYQHLKAAQTAQARVDTPVVPEDIDFKLVGKCLRNFDDDGTMLRWPSRRAQQDLAIWSFWSAIPAATLLQEKEINAILNARHAFNDAPILRRTMIGKKMLTRNNDGTDYLRIEQEPPAEARELIRLLKALRIAAP
ncbi:MULTISPECIES: DUF2087 domain-containing protein [Halocynthiibacter]|uniref:DUF2087 domain-containing protein n=1 Tax=Halocynthiibacter halioticoli TaxID=2986804 RepID=A0AAE3IXD0_9RHOB|nr:MULTISPECIES: DUF2087 domain-containing protein [Halocynthiibacter]MCV6823885.1 DUF2087 domain-containing protein [Halocynthiibacter halioticoli]MCW4056886.1 DUF2087 domain-containing protein [Halocynthiibacter sp. SDUM655004]